MSNELQRQVQEILGEKLNFYGDDLNYIHFKFGDCRKCYNFTKEFREKYPNFCKEYDNYFMGQESKFKNILDVVNYVYNAELPIYFYKNFTDEVLTTKEQAYDYIMKEYQTKDVYRYDYENKCYYDLDNNKIED